MAERDEAPAIDMAQQATVLRVVWLGLSGCSLIYGAVVSFVQTSEQPFAPLVAYALAGASILASTMSIVLKSVLLSAPRLAQRLQGGGQAAVVQMIVAGHLITWALADATAVMGMVLGLLGASPAISYTLIAVGTAIVLAQGPTAHTIPDLLAAAEQERLSTQA